MPYCSYDTVQSRTVGYVARGETKDGCQGWRHGGLVQTVHAKTVEQLDCTSMWARGAGELQLAGFFITIGHPLTQPESALEAIKLRRQKGLSMIGLHAEIAPTAHVARHCTIRPGSPIGYLASGESCSSWLARTERRGFRIRSAVAGLRASIAGSAGAPAKACD